MQVFGSGSQAQGGEVDYSKPLVSFDISSNEMFEALTIGREGPTGYSPGYPIGNEVDKIEEGTKLVDKLKKYFTDRESATPTEKAQYEENQTYILNNPESDGRWRTIFVTTDENARVKDTIIRYNEYFEKRVKPTDTIPNKNNPQNKKK